MKRTFALILVAACASAVSASPNEAHYSYTGPARAKAAPKASVIPEPTHWVPPHTIKRPFTRKPESRLVPRGGGVGFTMPGFTMPSFSQPTFASPGFTQPAFTQPGFSMPGFAQPGFSMPGYANPGFNTPNFNPPSFTAPGF